MNEENETALKSNGSDEGQVQENETALNGIVHDGIIDRHWLKQSD